MYARLFRVWCVCHCRHIFSFCFVVPFLAKSSCWKSKTKQAHKMWNACLWLNGRFAVHSHNFAASFYVARRNEDIYIYFCSECVWAQILRLHSNSNTRMRRRHIMPFISLQRVVSRRETTQWWARNEEKASQSLETNSFWDLVCGGHGHARPATLWKFALFKKVCCRETLLSATDWVNCDKTN